MEKKNISGELVFISLCPPPPKKNRTCCPNITYKICVGRRFAIEGEGLPYGIISPFTWGSSAMGFLPGGGLPYGIPSGGTFAIWYNFRGRGE